MLNYDSLAIEVTRRCNMHCAHCLRGNAKNVDIKNEYIEKMLSNVEHIGNLTFTGGEPSLNIDSIRYTLNYCKEHDIQVDGFYVVTNGKEVSDEFILLLMEWTMYCLSCNPYTIEEYQSGVALSQDIYHEDIDKANKFKLSALAVFREDDKKTDWTLSPLINKGRARSLSHTRDVDLNDIEVDGNYIEGTVTLTANGYIMPDCDYEYDEVPYHNIGTVKKFAAYERYLAEKGMQ